MKFWSFITWSLRICRTWYICHLYLCLSVQTGCNCFLTSYGLLLLSTVIYFFYIMKSLLCVYYIICSDFDFLYRYLLRRSALELFMVDRSNFFFDFAVFHTIQSRYKIVSSFLFPVALDHNRQPIVIYLFMLALSYHILFRALKGEEMHIELLSKLVLLIWTTYIWQLRFL